MTGARRATQDTTDPTTPSVGLAARADAPTVEGTAVERPESGTFPVGSGRTPPSDTRSWEMARPF